MAIGGDNASTHASTRHFADAIETGLMDTYPLSLCFCVSIDPGGGDSQPIASAVVPVGIMRVRRVILVGRL